MKRLRTALAAIVSLGISSAAWSAQPQLAAYVAPAGTVRAASLTSNQAQRIPITDHARSQVVAAAAQGSCCGPAPVVSSPVMPSRVVWGTTCSSGACDDGGGCSTGGACQSASCAGGCESSTCGSFGSSCLTGNCNGGCNMFTSLGCGCELGDPWKLSDACGTSECSSIDFGGWFSLGYHSADNGLFNDHSDQLNLNQAWIYAEKVAGSTSCSCGWGFRFDAVYGVDAQDTQAFGNRPGNWDYLNGYDHGIYGWALPQAYGELACGDWSVKIGHFYTLVGYEVVPAPDNFFYSHAITMYNSEPFTHTGFIGTYTGIQDVDLYVGWTLGWDTGFDQVGDGSSFLGGASLTLLDDVSLTYILTAGDFGARGGDAYSHSIVLDASLSENLNYVFQSDLVRVRDTGEDNVGINQYLLYSLTDRVGLGTRLEWWKGDTVTGYSPHNATLPQTGSFSYYAATVGANIRPHANFVVRPEVRFDWSPAADYDETIFGIDGIFTF